MHAVQTVDALRTTIDKRHFVRTFRRACLAYLSGPNHDPG